MDSSNPKLRDIAARLNINSEEIEAIKKDKKFSSININVIQRTIIIVIAVSALLGAVSARYLRPITAVYPCAFVAVGITFQKNSFRKKGFFMFIIGVHSVIAILSFFYAAFLTQLLSLSLGPQPSYGVFYKDEN